MQYLLFILQIPLQVSFYVVILNALPHCPPIVITQPKQCVLKPNRKPSIEIQVEIPQKCRDGGLQFLVALPGVHIFKDMELVLVFEEVQRRLTRWYDLLLEEG